MHGAESNEDDGVEQVGAKGSIISIQLLEISNEFVILYNFAVA